MLVIAPLGDWRSRAKDANIPIVSNVAADVLGALQRVVNAAQKKLVNSVQVTGTLNKPTVTDNPAPALTDGLKRLFGQMLQPHQDHRLLDTMRTQGEASTQP
jgi:hypothetical protein